MKRIGRAYRSVAAVVGLTAGLLAWSSPAAAAIQYNLESPSTSFPASGVGNVAGWAYSTIPGAKIQRLIEVQIDSEPSYRVPCCSSRGDVEAAHPAAPLNSGFSGAYNFQRLSPGMHTIKVTIKSTAAETKTFTKTFEVVKVSPFNYLKSFKWKSGKDCESLNGLDPAHGNAGAVCKAMRATSNSSGNPTSDCNGTIEFAFNRSSQTFQPVAGCDPQGTVDSGGGGGKIDISKLPPGFGDLGNRGNGGIIDIGKIPPGGICLAGVPSNISVSVNGLVPTFTFTTSVAVKVGVEVWEKGKVGQSLAALGTSPKGTYHQIKPHPFLTTIAPNQEYEYQIIVKSNCGQADGVVNGPTTFKTKKRVARAFIDKVKVIDDGDDWPSGAGEISFGLELGGKSKWTGEFSLDDGDVIHPPAGISWTAATDHFDAKFLAAEDDYPTFKGAGETTVSFGPSLTYSGGTWQGTRHIKHDNLDVKVWIRVEVSYE